MRAVICKKFGPPESLVVEDVDPIPLRSGQVRVAVHACGVNFPDTLIIENKYQFKPELPFTPGGEVAGEVVEVADGVVRTRVGDRVIAMVGWGGFAEELVVEEARTMPVPAGMDLVTAAGFTMTYGTSIHALKQRARLAPGETLLVLGAAGGVGLAAVELGARMGATVIAAASSREKLDLCRQYGATLTVNYAEENLKDRVKELTSGQGADVVYDAVGGDYFDQALRCINWNGRLLVVGFASGRIPEMPANLALLKGCSVVGVFWGAFTFREPETNAQNLAELGKLFERGEINPHVSATYPLEKVSEALTQITTRKALGKVVLTTGRS